MGRKELRRTGWTARTDRLAPMDVHLTDTRTQTSTPPQMLPPNRWNPLGLRILNSALDVFFWFDLILVFRTGVVQIKKENDERYISFAASHVTKKFLCGWFFLDLVATVP